MPFELRLAGHLRSSDWPDIFGARSSDISSDWPDISADWPDIFGARSSERRSDGTRAIVGRRRKNQATLRTAKPVAQPGEFVKELGKECTDLKQPSAQEDLQKLSKEKDKLQKIGASGI